MIILIALLACARAADSVSAPWSVSKPAATSEPLSPGLPSTQISYLPQVIRSPGTPALSPTPDDPHQLPTLRTDPKDYTIQAGDTLGKIADQFNVTVEEIVNANKLANPDLLSPGQTLSIPAPQPGNTGLDFKIIPDSELVYGLASIDFDIKSFVKSQNGYLAHYSEDVNDRTMTGAQIIQLAAQEFSVNPRLLLAVLEYQSGWVTRAKPDDATLDYPMGIAVNWRKGLYHQAAWAADTLNRGYYLWRVEGLASYNLPGGDVVPPSPLINAGTAGVQFFFSQLYSRSDWEKAVSKEGLYATYDQFFGFPFDRTIEPLVPEDIQQPQMQLPFERKKVWYFTGGPHGGWGDGSAWAAIDFAPPGEAQGCVASEDWVVAVADGPIIRAADDGQTVQDVDGNGVKADGLEQTGWVVLYGHLESRDRVEPGTYVHAGDRLGHPSCTGGVSTGTHLHLARRYNGEWIPADQNLPFVLDGWVSRGDGIVYDGSLERNGKTVEAAEGNAPESEIQR